MMAAMQEYIRARRRQSQISQQGEGATTAKAIDAKGIPLGDMSWPQYRAWAKYGNAMARRDYKAAEQMLPNIKKAFGAEAATVMTEAIANDYEAYLDTVIEAQCDSHDPESVWRKTMYMPFFFARLDRQLADTNRKALEARLKCGYES